MTKQMKLLVGGILFLLLLTALVMVVEKRSSVSRLAPHTEVTVADQPKPDTVKTGPLHDPAVSQVQPAVAPQAPQAPQDKTAVSQAQLDLVNKREEARLRRDEMLKVRAETIKKLGPGNTGEQQPEQ